MATKQIFKSYKRAGCACVWICVCVLVKPKANIDKQSQMQDEEAFKVIEC